MQANIRKLVPQPLRRALREALGRRTYAIRSYAQEGEDLLLARLFGDLNRGIYVDVGAHHPLRYSNTHLLHERGWRGINIDARPGSMWEFRKRRPLDANLEIGISRGRSKLLYHVFAEPALNTFDAELAAARVKQGWPSTGTVAIECFPLAEVIARELPRLGASTIDLLTVDAEGFDEEVLRSNDWRRFRPRAVVAETLGTDVYTMTDSAITRFLSSVGYRPFSKLVNSAIYLSSDQGSST